MCSAGDASVARIPNRNRALPEPAARKQMSSSLLRRLVEFGHKGQLGHHRAWRRGMAPRFPFALDGMLTPRQERQFVGRAVASETVPAATGEAGADATRHQAMLKPGQLIIGKLTDRVPKPVERQGQQGVESNGGMDVSRRTGHW